ncbi:MAG: hypothetical protein ACR2PL_14980 [Dehalococcoidia bacterium]
MYVVGPLILARGSAAAAGVGLVGGGIWAFLPRILGFFIFFLAAGLGYAMAEAVGRATNRKRGFALQLVAAFGVVLAYLVRNLLAVHALIVPTDIFGFLAVAIAVVVAINPLR